MEVDEGSEEIIMPKQENSKKANENNKKRKFKEITKPNEIILEPSNKNKRKKKDKKFEKTNDLIDTSESFLKP